MDVPPSGGASTLHHLIGSWRMSGLASSHCRCQVASCGCAQPCLMMGRRGDRYGAYCRSCHLSLIVDLTYNLHDLTYNLQWCLFSAYHWNSARNTRIIAWAIRQKGKQQNPPVAGNNLPQLEARVEQHKSGGQRAGCRLRKLWFAADINILISGIVVSFIGQAERSTTINRSATICRHNIGSHGFLHSCVVTIATCQSARKTDEKDRSEQWMILCFAKCRTAATHHWNL